MNTLKKRGEKLASTYSSGKIGHQMTERERERKGAKKLVLME